MRLTRSQIPELPSLLAAVTPAAHAAMVRAAACVWPRFFWLPVLEPAESALAPLPEACGQRCREELRRLQTQDAFSTLLWVLAHRAGRRAAASKGSNAKRLDPTPSSARSRIIARGEASAAAAESGDEAVLADAASALEDKWSASGPRRLASSPWLTRALSCQMVLKLQL